MSLHRTIVPAEVDEDEEPVDPKIAIDEKCSKTTACSKAFVEYEACAERIEKKGHGECSGQYMDYLACIDACVRRSFFRARAIFAPRNFLRDRTLTATAHPPPRRRSRATAHPPRAGEPLAAGVRQVTAARDPSRPT
jgi:ubiquinol-cytochrome c reductase subunit 6